MENKIKQTLKALLLVGATGLSGCGRPSPDKVYEKYECKIARQFDTVADTNHNGILELSELVSALRKMSYKGTLRENSPHRYLIHDEGITVPYVVYLDEYSHGVPGIVHLPKTKLEKFIVAEGK